MGKAKDIGGYVRITPDKLTDIRADLVRLDDHLQEWGFPQLVEASKNGVRRTQSPWMATLGDVTTEDNHCLKLNRWVESIGFVFTESLRNTNQLTVTRLKG